MTLDTANGSGYNPHADALASFGLHVAQVYEPCYSCQGVGIGEIIVKKTVRANPKRRPKNYYSTNELRERWGVARTTIERISDNVLPRFRPGAGKLIRFARKDVEVYEKDHFPKQRRMRKKKRSP